MTIQEQLKPCPFCGGEARLDEGVFFNVGCGNYECSMYSINKVRAIRNRDEAIKAWNTRTPEVKQFSGYSTETPNKDIGMLKLNRTKDIDGKHESNAIQGFRDSSTETPKGDV